MNTFTKDSYKCGQFVFKNKLQNNINNLSYDFLKKIYSAIKVFNNNQVKINSKNNILNLKQNKYLNMLLYQNMFMSLDVREEIEKSNLVEYQIIEGDITLNIYFKNNTSCNIQENIKNIMHICKFMFKLFKTNKAKLILNIVCTDCKKILDNDKILTPKNINSGSTQAQDQDSKTKIIHIWRCEELYKVLIHELIHFLDLDKNIGISKVFNVNSSEDIYVNEAYTEALATIIHCVYIIYKLNLDIDKFLDVFIYELTFLNFQCSKIMNHFNISSISNFFKKNTPTIKQTTNVFSYFFIKLLLLSNLDKFIHIVTTNNTSEFYKFIESKENWKDLIDPKKNWTGLNNNLQKTMRMTCLQLNV